MRRRFFQNTNNASYMFIEALENDFSLSITHTGKLQYCIDNGEYKNVGTSISGVNKGSRIYFVGYLEFYSSWVNCFKATKKCKIGGDIRSIIYGNDFKKYRNIVDGRLRNLFTGSTGIVEVESGLLKGLTELARDCYASMFNGCTSLVNAPELPATQLAIYCYASMFNGCTSLVNAPELPATQLANGCYDSMFYDCKDLNYIKMLAKDISAMYCLFNWVRDVSSTGTFVKNKDATWDTTPGALGASGVPAGWTVITEEEEGNVGSGGEITFYVNEVEFKALDGMTWQAYVDSDYNYIVKGFGGTSDNWKFIIDVKNSIEGPSFYDEDMEIYYQIYTGNFQMQRPSEKIIANKQYYAD